MAKYNEEKIIFIINELNDFHELGIKIALKDKKRIMSNFDEMFGFEHSDSSKRMLIDNILSNWEIEGYTKFGRGSKMVQHLSIKYKKD